MKKIDAHVHIVPAHLLGKTDSSYNVTVDKYGVKRFEDGSIYQFMPDFLSDSSFVPDTLIRCMDNAAVQKAVIMQSPCLSFNSDVIQAVQDYPERLKGSMVIEPFDAGCLKDIEEYHARGLSVMKFEMSSGLGYTHANMFPDLKFDSQLFELIWAKATELGITITIDPGPIGGLGYQIEELDRMILQFPKLRWVICHLGFPFVGLKSDVTKQARWNEMIDLAKYSNVWFDISALPALFNDEGYPYTSAMMFLREFTSKQGADKPIWGSDIPGTLCYATYPQLATAFEHCGLFTETEKDLLFYQNAEKAYYE